jgi:hypothetical protein
MRKFFSLCFVKNLQYAQHSGAEEEEEEKVKKKAQECHIV